MATAQRLAARTAGSGPPLVVLHGLFGAGRNWMGIARRLEGIRECHLLDARNHGDSPWTETMTYPEMAEDVVAYMDEHGLAPCDLLGHSMGGKTAMTLALTHSEVVGRLVVVDIAPVSYQHSEHARFAAAMRDCDLATAIRRADVETQIAGTVHDPEIRAFLMQNLVGEPRAWRWRLNLDAILAAMADLTGFPDFERPFPGPAVFLTGERSDYVRPRDDAAIRRLFPAAARAEVGGAGHWPHAEQPERFLALLRTALAGEIAAQ